jgi:hypothetical protein
MSINKEKARELVCKYINTNYSKHNETGEELLAIKNVVSHGEDGWTFFYDTKKSIDGKNWRYSLAGNHPIFIFKDNGAMCSVHPETDEAEIIKKHRKGNYSSEIIPCSLQEQVA